MTTTRMPTPAVPTDQGEGSALQLAELLTRASKLLRRGSAAQLEPLGLTGAQARVLRVVADADRPLRMADIASQLDVVPRSVTSMVDALERAGLVSREADADDRRSVRVAMTPRGRGLLDRLAEARRHSAEELFGSLGVGERRALHHLLGAVCRDAACGNGACGHDAQRGDA